MRTKVGLFTIFSLIILMIIPVHADVDKAIIDKETFTIDDKFTITGTVSDANRVTLLASMKGPTSEKLTRTAYSDFDGTFSFVPVKASDFFKSKGVYTINVFTEYQIPENGTKIKIEYDHGIAILLPDYVLELKEIGNKQVDEAEKLSFTASVTDSSIKDIKFSLEKNPSGSTINKDTGAFSWTPTYTQSGGYIFDIVVKVGPLEDRETIAVTVNDKPKPEQTTSEPEQTTSEPEQTTSEPEELGIAPFVDESKDPQSYVDRYNNESRYKDWFDTTYPKYSSIYEAVGLDEPKELAPFVDESKDPQSYVDRYNNEDIYKEWFDKAYPEMTIYEAVGLDEPVIEEPKFGECGEGTDLVNGICVIVDNSKGGGCLIATATYGSEMAPQVQLLREIRDNQLMKTDLGVSFMTGFNQFYYSFSPIIADMQRENPIFQDAVKIGITPLLSSLSIMSLAESDSEVLGFGIGVILMNIVMYVGVPAIIIFKARKYIRI